MSYGGKNNGWATKDIGIRFENFKVKYVDGPAKKRKLFNWWMHVIIAFADHPLITKR